MAEKTKPELAMNWSRTENGVTIRRNGASLAEAARLAQALDPFVLDYFEACGYDLRTFRFSIRKKKPEVR